MNTTNWAEAIDKKKRNNIKQRLVEVAAKVIKWNNCAANGPINYQALQITSCDLIIF